jgi:membrane protein DedA with SNARE-associated domain
VHFVQAWLATLPAFAVYAVVGVVIGVESTGIPLPGEFALVGAALLAATGMIDPWSVGLAASIGAIVGDSIGYAVGRRGGRALLRRGGERFPRHFGPEQLARAEAVFARYGVWAVFFGRFVALLRILAGPLAGALRVPYRKFFLANAAGGVLWSYATVFTVYLVGHAAERWLKQFSWVALLLAVLAGVATTVLVRRRAGRLRITDESGQPVGIAADRTGSRG